MVTVDPLDLIDLGTYPIHNSNDTGSSELLDNVRSQLADDGCAVLRGFTRAKILPMLVAEADSVSGKSHRSFDRNNVYFFKDDSTLPPDHPKRRF